MKFFGSSKFLLATVFITGAAVLVIEVLAVRMLSPYFGNTIFSVSSIISVILLALSVGYYFGGILADKFPKPEVFYGLIFLSGITVFCVHIINTLFVPYLGFVFPITYGPLIVSLLLFLIPALLLGTLSPFVIKLVSLSLPSSGIGATSGKVFFFSTLGSIFGSLFAGFYLIPHFGVASILISVSLVLSILGIIPILFTDKKKTFIGILVIVASISFGVKPTQADNVLYESSGLYSKISIIDSVFDGLPTRLLLLDKNNSSGMVLETGGLAFSYTKYYKLFELVVPEAKNFLVIGGGAYSVPADIINLRPDAVVHVSEIEPSLIELAYKYFSLQNTDRLVNHLEDGRRFLHDTDEKFDFIFGDGFASLYSVPTHMTTFEFFEEIKKKLSDSGAVAINFIGSLEEANESFILSEIRTFQTVFPNSYFFAVRDKDSDGVQNMIFLGINGERKIDFSPNSLSKTNEPILFDLENHLVDPNDFDLEKYPLLTDDFAPVDYLISKLLY